MTPLRILLVAMLTVVAVVWFVRSRPGPSALYAAERERAIMAGAEGRPPVVLLGDSFIEAAGIARLCGGAALNAGVSGARAGFIADLAEDVLPVARPRLVVVHAGTNDALRAGLTTPEDFRAALDRVEAAARGVGAKVAYLGIAPIGATGLAAKFDAAHGARLNRELAARGALPVPRLTTIDGLHPDAAGYAEWRGVAAAACDARRGD